MGRPGPNPLFFGVLSAVVLGVVAAVLASGERTIAHSNLIFRLAVGGIAAAVAYGVVAALWFAWHRRTFKGLRIAGSGADAPEQIEHETAARDDDIAAFMAATTAAIEDLNARIDALERSAR
jgi:hypothetical protein